MWSNSRVSAQLLVGLLPVVSGLQSAGGPQLNTPAAQSPLAPLSNGLAALSDGYSGLVKEHYLPMAFMQAGVLASTADVATQLMEHSHRPVSPFQTLLQSMHLAPAMPEPLIVAHVVAMATVASTMSGAANAVWLKQLEEAFPGRGGREVLCKTLIHAVILASIINSAYLIGVPLFTAFFQDGTLPPLTNPSAYFAGWTLDEFITLTKLEVCMFIPYNTIAFKFVSPRVRPLTHAMVSATFNVAVSAVTLGYFDKWCEQAMHVIS